VVVQGCGPEGTLSAGGDDAMMGMSDMMGRCLDAMSSMMGSGILFFVILLVLLIWVVGLAAVGALIFWGVRKLSSTRSASG
jgi:lipopolysaccharide/colanic/teichoic acid biosynthesis glycosyltransferase